MQADSIMTALALLCTLKGLAVRGGGKRHRDKRQTPSQHIENRKLKQ